MDLNLSIAFRSRGNPSLLLDSAKRAEASGFHRIWLVEVYEADVLALASAIARSTDTIGIASGVVNSYLRLPFLLAMGAATVSDVSGGRFALGIGVGSPPMGYASPLPSDTPITRLRETLELVTRLLRGEGVSFEGKLFRAEDLRLGVAPKHRIQVFSAAMGIRTVELAAQLADGVLLMLPTRRFLRDAKGVIRESLAKRRDAPRSFPIACHIVTSVSMDREKAEVSARRTLARYVTVPAYRESFIRLGFESDVEELERTIPRLGLEAAAERVSKRMADSLVVHGTPSDCRSKIAGYVSDGVDEPVVYPTDVTGRFPEDVNRAISLLALRRA